MPTSNIATPDQTVGRRLPLERGLLFTLLGLALIAVLVGPIKLGTTNARVLGVPAGREATLHDGPFQSDAVKPGTEGHQRLPDVWTRGSWVGGADFRGTHETDWYDATPKFTVLVCGYPAAAGNGLAIEARRRDGSIVVVHFTGLNPTSTWEPWYVAIPADAVSIRIRATDGSGAPDGWFGFSEPFTIRVPLGWQVLAGLQLIATLCLALVLFYGPALLWLSRYAQVNSTHIAIATMIGPILLVAIGLLCWAAGGVVAPTTIARTLVLILVAGVGLGARRISSALLRFPKGTVSAIAAGALLAGFGVSKANISIGAPGELYGGLVSRSLEVGGHSDSRVPFHVVQVVANHLKPFEPQAASYFSPWSFASRGPLGGLAAAPIVLATGADVPHDMPDQPWRPFDRQGFAAYRIAMIVLASLTAWAVYGVVAALATPAWGSFAAFVALLSPFFVHEMYFTWPKLIAAGLTLVSFLLAHRRNGFAAGGVLGLGYLFHPLAALSAPFIGVWLLVSRRHEEPFPWTKRVVAEALFGVAAGLLIIPWQLIGKLAPGGGQAVFATYFRLADNALATTHTWWVSRWENFANTFIPFHLLAFNPGHESINSVYAPSPGWVRAGFLYWNTLPFALGVPAFLLMVLAIAAAFRRALAATLLTWFGPTVLLIAYWGAADSGLMRHCGQVLFLSTIVLGVWALQLKSTGWQQAAIRTFLHPACLCWRGIEILVMAFGTTLLNGFPHWSGPYGINDVVSLAAAAICLLAAIILLAKAARTVMPDRFSESPSATLRS